MKLMWARKWFLVLEPLRYDDEIDYLYEKLELIANKGFYAFAFVEGLIFVYVERHSPLCIVSFMEWFSIRTYSSVIGSREQMMNYLVSKANQCGGTYHTSNERVFRYE